MMEESPIIRSLDPDTIRRICSGQVIISMASAVKELIENSIDAKASCIMIRFVDYGKESIEISDNGTGIDELNFSLLGRRNCTSKLSDSIAATFQLSTETFGFRGEALNSLCNLADVLIHTRHSNKTIGTVLTFDTNGDITRKELKPREIGTTVILRKLFHSIPVRRREFLTNFRRSFDKTLTMIYQYCLGIIGKKFVISHQKPDSGSYQTLFTSNGISLQSNINDIFDFKQFTQLMQIIQYDIEEDNIQKKDKKFSIEGFISKPDSGCGRSSTDRQFFYINNRPCDMTDVAKLINQIYKSFNRSQYPFILLKINIPEENIDRNLTPDKRKILFTENNFLLKTIQNSIEKMFFRETNQLPSLSMSSSQSIESYLSSKRAQIPEDADSSKDDRSSSPPVVKIAKINHHQPEPKFIVRSEPKKSQQFKHPFLSFLNSEKKQPEIKLPSPIRTPVQPFPPPPPPKPKPTLDNEDDNDPTSDMTLEEITCLRNNQKPMEMISVEKICNDYRMLIKKKKNSALKNELFQAKLIPDDNEKAEQELRHELSKNSFTMMRVIGQFNLGFILASLSDDIFIIDQHAADERYNFERFLDSPQLQYQTLVCPIGLRLTPMNEMILLDNLNVFERFGFSLTVDDEAEIGRRVKIHRIPMGKEWTAGQTDVEEIIAALRNSPLDPCFGRDYFIFSGLRREIAYRACRSSVMIGERLTIGKMKKLLSQMATVRDPWHCAHNRPTIRHLISIREQ